MPKSCGRWTASRGRAVVAGCLFGALLIGSPDPVLAEVISVNLQFNVSQGGVYNCGGAESPAAYPDGARCWTTGAISISPVEVGADDVLRIRLGFAGPYGLQWEDDGISGNVPYSDEFVQVAAWNSTTPLGLNNLSVENSLSFLLPRGDYLVDDMAWVFEGSMGGVVSQAYGNFTDTSFQFFGLASIVGPFSGGSGFPATVDMLQVHLGTGHFSIVRISEPSPLLLAGPIVLALALMRRYRNGRGEAE